MTFRRITLAALLALSVAAVGSAQQKPKPAAGAQGAATPAPPPPESFPTIDPSYVYEPAGRRDPFISLIGRGNDPNPTGVRPPGLQGLLIGEVTVKGVLRDRSGFFALLHAPDKKTYTVRVGDKLLDGTVKSINQDRVIFSQDVNDPLSLVKQREVPKTVRQAEGRG